MQQSELDSNAPGELISYGQRSYYEPDPLPPSPDLDLGDDFCERLSDATFWLGKLSGVSLELDFPPVLYTSLLRKEAMESAAIEGADVDYNALYSLETRSFDAGGDKIRGESAPDQTKDTQEVLNYEAAIEDGIEALDRGEALTVEWVHQLHETLLTGVPDDRVDTDTLGAYKTKPNHIGDFLPPVPDKVDGLMDALFTYYRTGGSYHSLVDIALFHYQFETIHPYGDGNGRLGRLLITLQLYDAGYLERPNLYLSEYFNRNKPTYVDRLEAVRYGGDWEAWVSFVIEGIARQAHESVDRTRSLADLKGQYDAEYGGKSYTKNQLALKLFEQPYVTSKTVQRLFDVKQPTASRVINDLVEEGVLEEVTGKGRNKEYRASEIFEILEQPPQTY
ncbi:filamentation induced by cAMP protein Fic [Halodesulfurarchaeum formicicum]|uniref:Filamentation induced by cAMP protein Fic n=1 Tax=Halodesulfurarchaeum formicicum TaxID=1873524 RepID=A0A1D8S636_9EURY|nr:Fic family protein [Halodesulfurarchaeum formicicum]AOW80824.1 filamentation induced by cAMP protein Fic [Halodesulfurarchaeum formicicum]APE96159.1 filamentation induced by cAMP protein Fic [Halodesulfurarchaeum formicicum]